jgi:hypothetical protein
MEPPIRETWPGPIRFPVSRQAAPGPEFLRPETKPKFRPVSPARDQIPKITCRTGRANAAYSRKGSVIRDSGNCVVADAVPVEPVSTVKFPANREINREFCQIRLLGAILPADTRANSKAWSEIPYSADREFLQKNREFVRANREFEPLCAERFPDDFFRDRTPLAPSPPLWQVFEPKINRPSPQAGRPPCNTNCAPAKSR